MGSSRIAQGDQLGALWPPRGWDREGGKEAQEGGNMGINVYIQLIHFVIQQKLTPHCKATILR